MRSCRAVEISIDNICLGDAGFSPLVDALSRNRHLRSLGISCNRMSSAFEQERLRPAVRANTSLSMVDCSSQ